MTEENKKHILTFHVCQHGGGVHDPQTFVAKVSVVNSTFIAETQLC